MRALALTTTYAVLLLSAVAAPAAFAQDPPPATDPGTPASANAGGASADPEQATPTVEGSVATIIDGVAYAPTDAPDAVKQLIWAGNDIVGMPYVYGGGHGNGFEDSGYDCSGTISYALHGAGLLRKPRDSTGFYKFGSAGLGKWVTIYTKSSHAYLTVAGIRLDTSAADDPDGGKGPRWRPLRPSDAGFKIRHPNGL